MTPRLLRAAREKKPADEARIKQLSEGLTQAKNHYLTKSALVLAQQVRNIVYYIISSLPLYTMHSLPLSLLISSYSSYLL